MLRICCAHRAHIEQGNWHIDKRTEHIETENRHIEQQRAEALLCCVFVVHIGRT